MVVAMSAVKAATPAVMPRKTSVEAEGYYGTAAGVLLYSRTTEVSPYWCGRALVGRWWIGVLKTTWSIREPIIRYRWDKRDLIG
jgi:hypothetical protein